MEPVTDMFSAIVWMIECERSVSSYEQFQKRHRQVWLYKPDPEGQGNADTDAFGKFGHRASPTAPTHQRLLA